MMHATKMPRAEKTRIELTPAPLVVSPPRRGSTSELPTVHPEPESRALIPLKAEDFSDKVEVR